ncbi:hypothetical protein BU16DRAFT_531324 [Lophium mytilinum]|uniref:Uncharacterized protein n=1 Tax=Lophium mytilinum TaxID=390894 RepID=A0A6A6QCN1_9PEZI|nr:hypothetical protein BU16DRAFT_531324 [Lophium mytilinum]
MFRVPSPISDATDDFNTAPARPAAEDPGDGTPGESQAPPRTIPPGWEREPAWMVSQTEASMDSYPRGSGFYFPKPTQEVLQVGDSVPPAWSSQEHYTGRAIPGRPPSQIVPDSYSGGIFAGGRSESFETDGSITPTQSSTNSVQSALPSFFKPHLGLDYAHVSYSADTTIRMPRAQVTASSSLGSDTSSMRTPLAPVRTPSSRANVPGISSSRETGRTATERHKLWWVCSTPNSPRAVRF